MADFAHVDALVAGYHRRGGQPGLAYGIVAGGELVHAAGLGVRYLGGPAPDAGTVFRIASMTKSFTASAILTLRDDGLLKLDDLAEYYVPELSGWPPVSPDSARISIRHLLTMTAGFPTDDPWGDRQQGLPLEEFAEFLAKGVSFNCAPGTRFEYSNLGYAILGRVITAVTGMAYPDYVRHRLLKPLGMTRTGFEVEEFEIPRQSAGPAGVAHGYRRSPGGWSEVAFDPAGAFAPMGGIFSCVRDLTRWVAGFAAAFPPGGDDETHPVRRASRREMQLPQILTGWAIAPSFPGDGASSPPATYGFGLFVDEHPTLGRIVSHSGGYPGFGSNMAWHPATGTGVIALGNSTYAAMAPLAARLLEAVVRQDGPAAHGNRLAGERGTVQVQIQLNPERPPRVQSLALAVPPAAGSALRVTLDAVVDWLNDGARDWPPSIRVADEVDVGMLARRLRMAAVWAGRCRVGAFKAGDGAASVAAELPGEHATITLALVIDPETRILRLAEVAP